MILFAIFNTESYPSFIEKSYNLVTMSKVKDMFLASFGRKEIELAEV